MDADRADQVFHALADPTRRDIVALVLQGEQSVSDLARRYPMSFAAVQKHVAVLERAGLVSKHRQGRDDVSFMISSVAFAATARMRSMRARSCRSLSIHCW
jgi:DNA-binding transcriptional ArsR family regulator